MPVVRIHGSAGPLAALAAQVGNQQGRMRQFDEASETFRNGLAGREMNLRETNSAFDRSHLSLLDNLMLARQRAMAQETGLNPDLDPRDMQVLYTQRRQEEQLGERRKMARTALQHAYANGIFGDPQSFDALGSMQQLGPLADADPDTVLREVGNRTMSHVANQYETGQRDNASKDLMAIAGKYNDDRRAFVETLAMGVGGGWVKPADAYRAIGDLIEQDRSQAGKLDQFEREQAGRFDLARMAQEGMDRRNKYATDQRRAAAESPSKRLTDDRDYKALQLEIDDAEDDFDAVRDDLKITAAETADQEKLKKLRNAQQAQKRLKQARQAAKDYLKGPKTVSVQPSAPAPLVLQPMQADQILDQLEQEAAALGRELTEEEVAEIERRLQGGR